MTLTAIDLETAQPAEFDTHVADLHTAHARAVSNRDHYADELHRAYGDRHRYVGRRRTWHTRTVDVVVQAQTSGSPRVQSTLERYDVAVLDAEHCRDQIAHADTVFTARGGWSRFFTVQGGHVHRTTSCFSLRYDTRIGWNPGLSGKSDADAVAELGPLLCTHCFPDAPVEWTIGKPDTDTCPGSNRGPEPGTRVHRGRTLYGTCLECCSTQQVTMSGIRKHKTPKEK